RRRRRSGNSGKSWKNNGRFRQGLIKVILVKALFIIKADDSRLEFLRHDAMTASWKKLGAVALVSAPFLAACTETPETVFDWGVNDHLPGHAAARHPQVAQDESRPAQLGKPPSAAPTRTVSKGTLAPIGHAADSNAPAF